MKRFFSNILAAVIALTVLGTILELAVRVFVDKSYYVFTPAAGDWVEDTVLGWHNKPNYEARDVRYGEVVDYKTNIDGFRPASVEREKPPHTLRVLLIGNSTVAARDMRDEESIHHYLDSLLDLSGAEFEVVNTGVIGYATDQALLTLKKYIADYSPDFVCYGYCVNDLYANTSHEYSGLSKPIFKLTGDSLLLEPPIKQNVDICREQGERSLSSLIQYSALYGLLRPYIQRIRISHSHQSALEQGGMGDFEVYARPLDKEPCMVVLARLVKEMDKVCRERSAKFLFYAHPDLAAVWEPYRQAIGGTSIPNHFVETKLEEIAKMDSVAFVPFVDYFLERKELGPFHHIPKDPHCNAVGYQLEAQVLAAAILSRKE